MFNPQAYENSRPDGISVLEIVNGQEAGEAQPRQFVPLKRTEVRGEITGPLAGLRLIQTYGYAREACDKVLEAVYRFPLPGDAAVTSVRVRFGDVEIRAELKERQQAEKDYQEAKREGRQAALATRESPDVFTLQVAGLQPDQDITVETAYVQLAKAEGSGWSLRIPLTTSPRYVRGDELTSRHAQGQPLLLLRDPGHRFSLNLTLPKTASVDSSTHPLDVSREGDRLGVRLREEDVVPDRDCVLSWRPLQDQDRPALEVLLHDDRASGQVYFLALVAPPATRDRGRGTAREVVLLVDHSGSMEGPKWQAADWAVEKFLSDLTERDAFALGLFHNTTRWWEKAVKPAGAGMVEEAVRFLKGHRDSGGTELGVALEQALDLKRLKGDYARHTLVITDAEVSDAGRIVRLADQESKRPDRRRISVLCIDAAPNSFLANELAERGGGVARFLTSQPQEEDITTALDEVLADWAEPVLAGLRLEVSRPQAEAAGREVLSENQAGWRAIDLGDLPAGRPVWVAGRVPRGDSQDLSFRVTVAGKREVASWRVDLGREADARPALKALFGARRVLGLEYLIHAGYAPEELREQLSRLGYDPKAVLAGKSGKVYAENTRADATAALRELLVREALEYGLASAETAFVAVRTEAGKPVEGTVAVANALPSGWSGKFLAGGGGGVVLCAMAAPPPAAYASMSMKLASGPAPTARSRGIGAFTGTARQAEALSESKLATVFSGVPQFTGVEAVLFDSSTSQDEKRLPEGVTIDRLSIRFPEGAPQVNQLDRGLCLLIFVEDLSAPRARVRLADLVRQQGERPLNLLRPAGGVVRVVLEDPAGAWNQGPPNLEVGLGWTV